MSRPRVLALTSEPPWPLDSGGHQRTFHLLRAVAAHTDLTIVAPAQEAQLAAEEPLRARGLAIRCVPVPSRTWLAEAGRLAGAIVRAEPYVMYRRHAWVSVAKAWRQALVDLQPDVVYFDHLDSVLYRDWRGPAPSCPAVADMHNVYSLLVARAADAEDGPARRELAHRQAAALQRMERRAARACQAIFAVSRDEAAYFRALGAARTEIIPNGVDTPSLTHLPTGRGGPPVVLFLGSLSWGPNRSAARFLAGTALPRIRSVMPDARLLLVGRDPQPDVVALGRLPGVELFANVPDVTPYLERATVLAVPLDAGGGTRLKILEAFASGLPVVTTAVGLEGIDAQPEEETLVAERPEFADALLRVLTDRALGQRLATAGRILAVRDYDWQAIGTAAAATIASLAESRTSG